MQTTTGLYNTLLSAPHRVETKINIAGTDYSSDSIISLSTTQSLFADNYPKIGSCVSGEIDLTMILPNADIPRMAQLRPYVRLADDTRQSEWLPKGVFYIDTRRIDRNSYSVPVIEIHGYDAMLKGEQEYFGANLSWPNTDINVVNDIASILNITIDSRTTINKGYTVQLPSGYTMRSILGYIAAMYCGCWIITDAGQLRLIRFGDIPADTSVLITEQGDPIKFGGDRILV